MNLDVRNWKEYKISDLFIVKYGVNLELNACEEVDKTAPDSVNFVARTASNNGVTSRVRVIDGVEPQEAGLISVAGGGSVLSTFVQNEPFYSGRDLYTLRAKENISLEAKLFVVTVIEQNKYKYSYGRQANKTLPDILLKLPAKEDGSADWQFMEDYIKSLHHKPLTTANKTPLAFDLSDWKEFKISSIFTIKNGKGITKAEIKDNEGDFAVVQSGEENNGVLGKINLSYCKSAGYTYSEYPCLTVARSGSAGYVSFQRDGCVVGDSAKILLLDDDIADIRVYLFLQTMLTANRFKYAYGRKVTEEKYMNDVVKLPIERNQSGKPVIDSNCRFSNEGFTPDWDFMKDYISSLPYGDRLEG